MSFKFRELTKEEKWVTDYENLVNYICEGYEEVIYEYTNDLACRLFIQEAIEQESKSILSLLDRIRNTDKKLQAILQKTSMCIYGIYPKEYFWFWGIPRNSNELMNEAKLNHWI